MRTARFSCRLGAGGFWLGGLPRGVHPPVNRLTDRCKNITLPQTSFAGGNHRLYMKVTKTNQGHPMLGQGYPMPLYRSPCPKGTPFTVNQMITKLTCSCTLMNKHALVLARALEYRAIVVHFIARHIPRPMTNHMRLHW